MKWIQRLIIPFVMIVLTTTQGNSQAIAKFSFEGNTGNSSVVDSISGSLFSIVNHYNNPERIVGVKGSALRLDGNSTWALNKNYTLPKLSNQLGIEAWYATEAFSPNRASIVCQESTDAGFDLSIGPMGNVYFRFYADGKRYQLQSTLTINKYAWNHFYAYIDLPNKLAKVFVNGEQFAQWELDAHHQIDLANEIFYIGRFSDEARFDGYLLTVLNGAIDELTFFNSIWKVSEIKEHYLRYVDSLPDLVIDVEARHGSDFLRPKYHPMPKTSWANENYGMTYYNGKYHMFFQKNPNFPSLYFMHWGHLSSPDLVQWEEEKITLAPAPGFGSFGNWSGTTIINDEGEPLIFYTGVDGHKAGIGGANLKDDNLLEWEKFKENPVVSSPPNTFSHMDFRDPYLWKHNGFYYMIVGSGLQNSGGGILFSYKSTDMVNWESIEPIFKRTDVDVTGVFWEMPAFIKVSEKAYMVCVTPIPPMAKTIYWIGEFINEKFVPYNPFPKDFELINGNLLSPAFGVDDKDRVVYSAIIPESRNVDDQKKAGWRHTFSTVRSVRLLADNETIGHIPHPNLCRLHSNIVTIEDLILEPETTFNLLDVKGNQLQMDFSIKASDDALFQIQVLKNEDETEYTALRFDFSNDKIIFDRRKSSLKDAVKDYKSGRYVLSSRDSLHVQVFIDHSIVEVFIDHLVVFSGRVYPSREASNLVDFILEKGDVTITQLNAYTMKTIGEEMDNDFCEESELPNLLPVGISTLEYQKKTFEIKPNPATNSFKITSQELINEVAIYDISGRFVKDYAINYVNDFDFDISDLALGVYVLVLQTNNREAISQKLVKH